MIKEVNYYPQYLIEETVFNDNYAIISITDGDYGIENKAKIRGTNNILRLEFLDIEEKPVNSVYTEFNESLGLKVKNFVQGLMNSEKEYKLAIHCRMGASRSPAVALYVHKLTDCDFPGYSQANNPNKLVLNILEKLSNIKIEIPKKDNNTNNIFLIPKIKV